jgi:hypothetical protein
MGLIKKASTFLNKTVVGKAISAVAPKATGAIKAIASKGTTAAVKASPIVQQTQTQQRSMNKTESTTPTPKWQKDLVTFFSKYYLYLIGAAVIAVGAWFFLIKKKRVVRRARRK